MLRRNISGLSLQPIDGGWMDIPITKPIVEPYNDYPIVIDYPPPPKEFEELEPVSPLDEPLFSDPIDNSPVLYKQYTYSGQVVDQYNNGIPGASVFLTVDGNKVAGQVADSKGYFSITVLSQADSIVISSAGYKPWQWPASFEQHVFELEPDVKDLDPVVITADKKNYSWLLLLLLIPLLKEEKKVGKIDLSTILAIAAGLGVVLGFDTIIKILRELGIGQTPEGHDYDDQVSDPGSFWSPAFWKTGPSGTLLLKQVDIISINDQIVDSFSIWGDNEAQVIAAFKRMKTQSQLSFFADWFAGYQGMDLLKWLKGSDIWPDDRLSVKEISVITNYFKQLPKYK